MLQLANLRISCRRWSARRGLPCCWFPTVWSYASASCRCLTAWVSFLILFVPIFSGFCLFLSLKLSFLSWLTVGLKFTVRSPHFELKMRNSNFCPLIWGLFLSKCGKRLSLGSVFFRSRLSRFWTFRVNKDFTRNCL